MRLEGHPPPYSGGQGVCTGPWVHTALAITMAGNNTLKALAEKPRGK
jgi:hypothetical protein